MSRAYPGPTDLEFLVVEHTYVYFLQPSDFDDPFK